MKKKKNMSLIIRKISKYIIMGASCLAVIVAVGLLRFMVFEPDLIQMLLTRIGG